MKKNKRILEKIVLPLFILYMILTIIVLSIVFIDSYNISKNQNDFCINRNFKGGDSTGCYKNIEGIKITVLYKDLVEGENE